MVISMKELLKTDKKIHQIANSFNILKLGEISEELQEFFEKNFALYLSKKDVEKKLINENGFSLTDGGCSFKVLFHPDCVNPSQIVLVLNNLEGCFSQIFNVSFEDARTISITKSRLTQGLEEVDCKSTTKKIFIDSKIIYEQRIASYFSPTVELSRNGIIENETFYYNSDKGRDALRSTISFGEANFAYGNYRKFERLKKNCSKEISENEFTKIRDEVHQLNPVLKKLKK